MGVYVRARGLAWRVFCLFVWFFFFFFFFFNTHKQLCLCVCLCHLRAIRTRLGLSLPVQFMRTHSCGLPGLNLSHRAPTLPMLPRLFSLLFVVFLSRTQQINC